MEDREEKAFWHFYNIFLRDRRGEDFFVLYFVEGGFISWEKFSDGHIHTKVIYESINNLWMRKHGASKIALNTIMLSFQSQLMRVLLRFDIGKYLSFACLLSCSCSFSHISRHYFRSYEQCTSRHFFISQMSSLLLLSNNVCYFSK